MAIGSLDRLVLHLRRVTVRGEHQHLGDGELLGLFLDQSGQSAFETLVIRHGPMVLGTCTRVVGNEHDAEDAFQAVFLVLVRKGHDLRNRENIGDWLYGVAHNIALKARENALRKQRKERLVALKPDALISADNDWQELRDILDEELIRLSAKCREAIVLCDLEGKSRQETARQLGIPEGTVSSRLTTGRRQLAERLARRGLSLSGGTLATLLAQNAASASVPLPLVASTVKTAATVAAGFTTAGVVSATVAALTKGEITAMFVAKLKNLTAFALAFVLAVGLVFVGQSSAVPTAGKEEKKDAPKKEDLSIIKTIVTAGSGKVTIRQSGKETINGVAVNAEHVKNGVLELKNTVDLVIEVKNFPALVLAGSGSVIAEDINTKQAVVSMLMSCSGEVRLSGSAVDQIWTHEGTAEMNGRNLKGKTGVVNNLKSGSVTVNVTETLQAYIAGSGSVGYVGTPVVTKNVVGTGTVVPVK